MKRVKKGLTYTACGIFVGGMAAAYLREAITDAQYVHEMEREYAAGRTRAFPEVLGAVIRQDLENGHYARWLFQRASKRLGH